MQKMNYQQLSYIAYLVIEAYNSSQVINKPFC